MNWKKLGKYCFESTLMRLLIFTALSIGVYFGVEIVPISDRAKSIINVGLLLSAGYLIYKWISKPKVSQEMKLYFLLVVAVMLNRFYDPTVVASVLKMDMKSLYKILILLVLVRAFWHFIYNFLRFLMQGFLLFCEGWLEGMADLSLEIKLYRASIDKERAERERMRRERHQKHEEERAERKREGKDYIHSASINDELYPMRSNTSVWALFLLTMLLSIGLYLALTAYIPDLKGKIIEYILKLSEQPIKLVIAIISILILLELLWIIIIGVAIEGFIAIRSLVRGPRKKDYSRSISYMLFAGALMIVSVFVTNNFDVDYYDLFFDGKIILFPLGLSVLLPIFSFISNWLFDEGNFDKFRQSEEVKEIKNAIYRIALSLVRSILRFVEFITSDFLEAIQNIVDGEEDED